jgi:hypothetical protein
MGSQSKAPLKVFASSVPIGEMGSQSQGSVAVFWPSIPLLTVPRRLVFLSKRILRRVLAAKESLFEFGTFVPRTDKEADKSPEAD